MQCAHVVAAASGVSISVPNLTLAITYLVDRQVRLFINSNRQIWDDVDHSSVGYYAGSDTIEFVFVYKLPFTISLYRSLKAAVVPNYFSMTS